MCDNLFIVPRQRLFTVGPAFENAIALKLLHSPGIENWVDFQ